jgi:integrase
MPDNKTTRTRRPNREGTLYEIKTGRDAGKWRAEVRLADGTRRTFFAGTREEAEGKLLHARVAVANNVPVAPPRTTTLGTYVQEWLTDRRDHLRPNTWNGHRVNVEHHILPSLGRIRLADLQPADVRRLHRESKARGLSPRSVRYVHLSLNLALKQAEADGLVARNVATLAKAPAAEKVRIQPFTPAEALKFLEVLRASGDEHEALYVTTLGLGLRRGEVLGLRWSDVNWSARTVTVAGQLQREKDRGLVWVMPKTDASVAVLDVPDFVMDALLAQRDREAFGAEHATWRKSGYVFTNGLGGPLEPDNVTHAFPKFLKAHGLRHQRFHDLRHATASLLLARGVPLWQVSKILRHASIAITSDTYGHMYSETGRAAADVMDAFLSQSS